MAKSLKNNRVNPKSPKIKEFIRTFFLSFPLFQTRAAGEKVLDLGCGWGFYFKINPRAYGIDVDKKCIEYLKKFEYKVVEGNIKKRLPFGDNSFKWVIAHDVLEHFELEEVKKIFSETCRILEPGGCFLILIPNQKGFKFGLKKEVGHKHFIVPKEIFLIAKRNFVIKNHYSHPLPRFIGNYFTHNKEVIILKKAIILNAIK